MASEKILKDKMEKVSAVAKKIKEAKIVILADYRGINVEDVTKLRARAKRSRYRICNYKK